MSNRAAKAHTEDRNGRRTPVQSTLCRLIVQAVIARSCLAGKNVTLGKQLEYFIDAADKVWGSVWCDDLVVAGRVLEITYGFEQFWNKGMELWEEKEQGLIAPSRS